MLTLISNGATGNNLITWNINRTNTAAGSAAGWSTGGNSGTIPSSSAIGNVVNNNVLGTTDGNDFVLGTNDLEQLRVANGGNIGIHNSSPNTSATLDITSTTQGLLPPRMTTTQRNLINVSKGKQNPKRFMKVAQCKVTKASGA